MFEQEDRNELKAPVLRLLVDHYLELTEKCYRISVSCHGERGRFRKGHRGRSPHPVLLKKADLDRALVTLYERFFGNYAETAISTSNSLPQGSETWTELPGQPVKDRNESV